MAVVAVVDVADAFAKFGFPDEPFAGVSRRDGEFNGDLPPDGEFEMQFARAVLGILPECPGHARERGQERAVGGDEFTDFLAHPLLWAIAGSGVTEANELIEARKLIEVELAGLAAVRSTPDDLQQVGVHLDAMESSLHDTGKFLEADVAFHLALGQAGHNRILLNSLLLIRNLTQQWVRTSLERYAFVAVKALEQHRAIFLAVAKRNPARAREAMQSHLDAMASFLQSAKLPSAAPGNESNAEESANRAATQLPELTKPTVKGLYAGTLENSVSRLENGS